MKTGSELIAEERQRQIEKEGWTPAHDDKHTGGELNYAAASYTWAANHVRCFPQVPIHAPQTWPWDLAWWKPAKEPTRNLVKAGALIAAEIDRLQRLENIPS